MSLRNDVRLDRRRLLRRALALAAAGLALPLRLRAQAPRSRFVAYPFALGVASGYPRTDGVSLWTRLAPSPLDPDGGIDRDEWVTVTWQVAEDERFAKVVAEGRQRAVSELAHSVHTDVDGLRPGRPYFYRFVAGDEVSPTGRTRTADAPGSAPSQLRFALGSCQHFEQGHFEAYRHIVADQADLMVFVGDYIYESSWGDDLVRRHAGGETYELADYRVRHAQYKTDPDLQAAHAAMPWLLTWDDHEVDNDPAGDLSEHLDPRFLLRRAAAYQAYFEHMPLPRALAPRTDGSMRIYTDVGFGDLARFYLLDDRQYRSANACNDPFKGGGSTDVVPVRCAELDDPARTMLGAEQERWLSQALVGSRARWNVLAQQTLMTTVHGRDADGAATVWTDGWAGFSAARERLFRAIETPALRNPIVVGGDIHATVVSDLVRDPFGERSPALAAEVCGTSISSQGWPAERYDAYARDNPHLAFVRGDRRGYCLFTLGREADVRIRAVDTVKRRDSTVGTLARFVVEDGRRGLTKA